MENKYTMADRCAESVLENLNKSNKLEIVLRQMLKQAFIEGVEYGKSLKED